MRFVGVAIASFFWRVRGAEDGGADEVDAAGAEVGEADAGGAIVVGSLLGSGAEHVPSTQRVVGQVEMRIDNEHRLSGQRGEVPHDTSAQGPQVISAFECADDA